MTKYEEYALLQKEIDVLDAKKELLRAEIEVILPEDGYKDENINIFWTLKNKYNYSIKVKELEAMVKSTKKEEEEKGLATKEETKQLTIRIK
jgi:hypothetical protein